MRTRSHLALTGIIFTNALYSVGAVGATPATEAKLDTSKVEVAPKGTADEAPKGTADEASKAASEERTSREYSQYRHNSLHAMTGLMHLVAADSGAPGTFRVSLLTSYFKGSGFLCPAGSCGQGPAGVGAEDSASRMGMDLAISATVLPFLEVSAGTHSHAFSDDYGKPPLVQVLGDTIFGVKGFLPRSKDQLFGIGGLGELRLLNGSGSIGTHSANVTFAALGTLDLSNRSDPTKSIPLRFHTNLGYLFDNSASVAKDTESSRHAQITRMERFGLGINRLDTLFWGIGGEFVSSVAQPFIEWTIDAPTNRQGYKCPSNRVAVGDVCMNRATGLQATPSRLTLGTRLTPGFYGFNALLALDIGTSGSSKFVDERAPEIPWNLYLGVGWAADTVAPPAPPPLLPPPPRIVKIAPPPEHHIIGTVVDEESAQPIARAILLFEGRELTGMVSQASGNFESGNLEPGEYLLRISADGFKEGTCKVVVSADSVPENASESADTQAVAKPRDANVDPEHPKVSATQAKCSLKAVPPVGSIQGVITNATTGGPIAGVQVKVRDKRDRVLELQTDGNGAFNADNVPAGPIRVSMSVAGYLPNVIEAEVKKKVAQHASMGLYPLPKKPNVKAVGNELKFASPLRFGADSAELTAEAKPLVQELAALLLQHREWGQIEIQAYTDEPSGAAQSKRLSEERGQQVRSQLVALGVDSGRLSVKAFGAEKPLIAGSATEAAREKNRRILLRILQ